jgi:hypothetical protein
MILLSHFLLLLTIYYCQGELRSFFESHFSESAVDDFEARFLRPSETHNPQAVDGDIQYEEYEEFEEDDGLGYYEDGVKRTLTDEQIAMFRHSELEALRREQEKASSRATEPGKHTIPEELEDGEASPEAVEQVSDGQPSTITSKKKKRKSRGKKRPQVEKADLRKRTWDVVETGLGSLDYDEDSAAAGADVHGVRRQRISYDD